MAAATIPMPMEVCWDRWAPLTAVSVFLYYAFWAWTWADNAAALWCTVAMFCACEVVYYLAETKAQAVATVLTLVLISWQMGRKAVAAERTKMKTIIVRPY